MNKTSKQEFSSIAEARLHYLLKGYKTVERNSEYCLMTKLGAEGEKLSGVQINREDSMLVKVEEIFKVL